MNIFYDDDELTGVRMVQSVLDLFDNRPSLQRMTLGLLASMEQDVSDEDDYGADSLARGRSDFHLCSSLSDNSRDRGLNRAWSSSSVHKLTPHYYTVPRLASVNIQEEESDSERRASSLEEKRKVKKKAEKKRLKKQKQKERKQLEKLDKTKQSPVNNEVTEEKDDPQKSEPEVNKAVNGDSKNDNKLTFGIKLTAKKKDSSEDESSGDSEELDMTSSFVSKAALIAQRKLEQKAKPERKEKKNTSVHEETKSSPTKANEEPEVEKKDSAAATPTLVDNVKVSTEYAITGNRFASAGDFNMAVKYFTDAIKHNPTEFKLFGNRSFCFEKMQQYEKSLADAELSLSMCPGWVKGLFRRGRALAGLKRYEEAAQAFREVLKKDGSCAEAAQELMRVQITQIMEYGFTREQSSNALIIHGTVKKALEVLTNLNNQPGAAQATSHPAQIANFTGVSRVLSASATPAAPPPPQSHDAPKPKNKPLGPVQNMSNVQSHPKPAAHPVNVPPPQELFPVWVGNLVYPVTEFQLIKIFNKIGYVHSVKLLIARRCAFVNYSIREFCDEAIRRFNGFELNGNKIAVRYPDRFPPGLGISRSALKADDMQDENFRHVDFGDGRKAVGLQRPYRPHRDFPDCSGNHKY